MSRPVTSDVEKMARGQAVARDAFLGLLADPEAQEDLAHIAQARDLLQPVAADEADREHVQFGGHVQPAQHIAAVAVGGDTQRDVAR